MLKGGTNNVVGGSSSNWSRACDTCLSAKCTVYCHADSAYLCSACDARVHAMNKVASRHERVWVCEACERAPAAFLCRADAASLCSSCDAEIHSANRLASRHHRVPVLPFSGCAIIGGEEDHGGCQVEEEEADEGAYEKGDDEAEAASWLLPHPVENDNNDENDESNEFLFCGDECDDEYMELVDCNNNSCGDQNNQLSSVFQDDDDDDQEHLQKQSNYGFVPQRNHGADCVVPIQCGGEARAKMQQHSHHFPPGLDFDSSKAGFCYNGFISQTVSVSSLEVGVVPESTFSDVSISHLKPPIGTSDLFPPMPMHSYLYRPMDREARVLRYREKKKTRKFEKKIRYASRKAYAEVRPRIKGRFAKRTDIVEAEVDTITEAGYGIVPSFSLSR